MKFEITHRWGGITLDEYEALFFDEDFASALAEHLRLGREVLRLDRAEDRIVRHVRCEPDQDPDSPEGRALAKRKAGFVEELDYDRRARRGEWRTIPNLIPDRVKTNGTIELRAEAGGVVRTVRGVCDVKLFGLGRLVEKQAVKAIEKSYDDAAAFTAEWIARARAHRR
ncbi:MAG TPA: DUF2505 family protein [Kofleriaceae bacterium]|nr:DUF2505 family protein [Kofleriaceae bacterium]